MSGNTWMFYLTLILFVLLVIVYGFVRSWIEIRKWKIKKTIRNEG